MHALGACGEEDARGGPGGGYHAVDHLGGEAVADHGTPAPVHLDAIFAGGPVHRQHQDHLQAREGVHEPLVLRPEAREVLGGDEGEVHARLEDEALLLRAVDVEALGVPDIVGEGPRVLRDQNERRVAREAVPQPAQP